jgi:hypothetical protein
MEDVQVTEPARDTALLIYRATAQRAGQPQYEAWITSGYVGSDGGWQMALHQQSPVA